MPPEITTPKPDNEILVVTFATTGKSIFYRDYSNEITQMRDQVEKLGMGFVHYDQKAVLNSDYYNSKHPYFLLRKGAGFWHWKPTVLLDAASKTKCKYIFYLDIDLVLRKNPSEHLSQVLEAAPLAAFRSMERIGDWTDSKVVELMGASEVINERVWLSGIIALKNWDLEGEESLMKWQTTLNEPRFLLDRVNANYGKHRHDQSIWSILIAKHEIEIADLGAGFWGGGITNRVQDKSEAWIVHGEKVDSARFQDVGLRRLISEFFHITNLGVFWIANMTREITLVNLSKSRYQFRN